METNKGGTAAAAAAARRPLLDHLTAFARTLRSAGVTTDAAKLVDLGRCIDWIDLSDRASFYAAARAVFVSRYDDLAMFDAVFDAFWARARPDHDAEADLPSPDGAGDDSGTAEEQTLRLIADGDEDAAADEEASRRAYSASEILRNKNLGDMSDAEIERARRIMAELIAVLATVRNRRTAPAAKGSRLDLRRIMRRNLVHGRDGVRLVYRKRRVKKLRLMLLCDVSGSMERYSNFLIQFIYALRRELPAVEVGVFSTRMTVVTDLLDDRDVGESLRRITATARDWGGGTDIGRCLHEFNDRFARELLRSKTVMVILSDGWDRGDPGFMRDELARIHRQVHKLIWLNPLLGAEGYEPLCRGIRTALPFMDYFLPAHNLESLAELAKTLRAVWR